MSKYHIVEGSGSGTGRKYFQVFIGSKTIGDPCRTRQDAESYIQYLEKRDRKAAEERERDAQ
ncbi:hypothetical protein B7H20_25495 [Pseudomonas aeruginosa]|nr:hypothetical protein B7H20_25495 [Pseudomonas aeruginosa]